MKMSKIMPAAELPLGRYLLLAGRNVGGNTSIGLTVGTRALPDHFLEAGCSMFALGEVTHGVVLPHAAQVNWPDWNTLADGAVPEMRSWVVGYRMATASEECPWDLYFWDGNWWDDDGTEMTEQFPTYWMPVPEELLKIALASQPEHGKTN